MEIVGKIIYKGETIDVSTTFKKREFAVETDEQYPQKILIELVQDKVDLLNNIVLYDKVKVSINLAGREWVNPQGETKYFNSIKGWRIEKTGQGQPSAPVNESAVDAYMEKNKPKGKEEEHDDLPF